MSKLRHEPSSQLHDASKALRKLSPGFVWLHAGLFDHQITFHFIPPACGVPRPQSLHPLHTVRNQLRPASSQYGIEGVSAISQKVRPGGSSGKVLGLSATKLSNA